MTELLNKLNTYLNEEIELSLNEGFDKTLESLQMYKPIDESHLVEYNGRVDEAVSVTLIISLILGMPTIIKTIAKSFKFVLDKIKKLFGKDTKEDEGVIEKLIKMTDKWHHAYIVTLRQVLRMGGVFKSAGITDKGRQEKATEVVFYTIIFGFAILGGVATGKSILHVAKHMSLSNISFASLEGVLTSIKSNEVVKFIKSIKSA